MTPKPNKQALAQKFKGALIRHRPDWPINTALDAARICAAVVYPSDPAPRRPLKNDTPELAQQRYERGGFGKPGSAKAMTAFRHYISLFPYPGEEKQA
jgi:hypothetical protein